MGEKAAMQGKSRSVRSAASSRSSRSSVYSSSVYVDGWYCDLSEILHWFHAAQQTMGLDPNIEDDQTLRRAADDFLGRKADDNWTVRHLVLECWPLFAVKPIQEILMAPQQEGEEKFFNEVVQTHPEVLQLLPAGDSRLADPVFCLRQTLLTMHSSSHLGPPP